MEFSFISLFLTTSKGLSSPAIRTDFLLDEQVSARRSRGQQSGDGSMIGVVVYRYLENHTNYTGNEQRKQEKNRLHCCKRRIDKQLVISWRTAERDGRL